MVNPTGSQDSEIVLYNHTEHVVTQSIQTKLCVVVSSQLHHVGRL